MIFSFSGWFWVLVFWVDVWILVLLFGCCWGWCGDCWLVYLGFVLGCWSVGWCVCWENVGWFFGGIVMKFWWRGCVIVGWGVGVGVGLVWWYWMIDSSLVVVGCWWMLVFGVGFVLVVIVFLGWCGVVCGCGLILYLGLVVVWCRVLGVCLWLVCCVVLVLCWCWGCWYDVGWGWWFWDWGRLFFLFWLFCVFINIVGGVSLVSGCWVIWLWCLLGF